MKRILCDYGIAPAPERSQRTPWKTFLQAHWEGLAACDLFTVEVLTLDGLKRYLVLFVIELKTRYIHIAGIHPVPDGAWMEQMARNLTDPDEGFLRISHHLIHDRDPLYTGLFEEILRRGGYLQRRSTEAEPHRFVAGLTIALRRRSDSCATARHSRTDPATRLPSIHGRDGREIGTDSVGRHSQRIEGAAESTDRRNGFLIFLYIKSAVEDIQRPYCAARSVAMATPDPSNAKRLRSMNRRLDSGSSLPRDSSHPSRLRYHTILRSRATSSESIRSLKSPVTRAPNVGSKVSHASSLSRTTSSTSSARYRDSR